MSHNKERRIKTILFAFPNKKFKKLYKNHKQYLRCHQNRKESIQKSSHRRRNNKKEKEEQRKRWRRLECNNNNDSY
jgi:hypothetical protein